jgi:hypothetical protein
LSSVSIDTPAASRPGAAEAALGTETQAKVVRTRWWGELLVIGWLLWVYDAINNLAPLRLSVALAHARDVLKLEQSLHIDPELSLDRWLAHHHTIGLVLSDYYDNAHFIITLGLLGLLWWRGAEIYRPLRNTLVLVNVFAFLVFWRYPVAPPRMLHGFTDVVAATGAIGSWHNGALASQANELAAMPSLHMAWAVWCSMAVWRLTARAWLRALGVLYPCLTGIAVLATGNHFVLDIVGGLLTLGVAVAIAELFERWRRRRADTDYAVAAPSG